MNMLHKKVRVDEFLTCYLFLMKEVTDTLKAEKEIIVSVFHHGVSAYGASIGNMVPLPPASLDRSQHSS